MIDFIKCSDINIVMSLLSLPAKVIAYINYYNYNRLFDLNT